MKILLKIVDSESRDEWKGNQEFINQVQRRLGNSSEKDKHLKLLISSISFPSIPSALEEDEGKESKRLSSELSAKFMEMVLIRLYSLEAQLYDIKPGEMIIYSKLQVLFPDSIGASSLQDQPELLFYVPPLSLKHDTLPHHCCSRYDTVVLGGTFDYLHSGHKILLSMAAWFCSKRLTVGVSGTHLLSIQKLISFSILDFPAERIAKKKYSMNMESLSTRIAGVQIFLNEIVRQGVRIEVVAIKDDFGPTRSDPTMDLLVGSAETAKGCEMGTLFQNH